MLDETTGVDDAQSGDGGAATGGNGDLTRSAAHTRQAVDALQSEQIVAAALQLNAEHIAGTISLKSQELGNDDRRSEREYQDRRRVSFLSFIVAIVVIIAVVAIIVFLVIYDEGGLLGYILSGIGGLIAGAFGGYGYANRPR